MSRAKFKAYPVLGIGVLQWNASQHTISLLKDLHNSPCAVVVCDNGSEPQHLEAVLDYFLSTCREMPDDHCPDKQWLNTLIQNRHNSGFAAGMNLCITTLLDQSVDWIWLLNNDTRVEPESINIMLETIKNIAPGVYGTKMREPKSGKDSYGNRFSLWSSRFKPVSVFAGDYKILGDWYPDGASMLIHREVFEKAGLLSEEYFIYFEELDFKRRVNNDGYPLMLLPEVMVKHTQAGSSSQCSFVARRMYHETYSTLTYYKIHHRLYLPLVLLLRTPARLISLLVKGRLNEVKPVINATIDFLMSNKKKFSGPAVLSRRYFCSNYAK